MIGQVFAPASLKDLWPLLEDGVVVMAGGTDLLVRLRAGRARGPRSRDGDYPLGCASPTAMLRAKAASASGDDPLADAQPPAPARQAVARAGLATRPRATGLARRRESPFWSASPSCAPSPGKATFCAWARPRPTPS